MSDPHDVIRQAFEAWAGPKFKALIGDFAMARDCDGYVISEVSCAWSAWRAATKWVLGELDILISAQVTEGAIRSRYGLN